MPRYYVVTPEYQSGGDYYEPPEHGCDVIEVEAPTKRTAVTAGVKAMLKKPYEFKWCRWQRSDGCNPFAGVRAIEIREPSADEAAMERYCDRHPDDVAARLADADAVQEAGDEDRAAQIRACT